MTQIVEEKYGGWETFGVKQPTSDPSFTAEKPFNSGKVT